MAAPTARQRIWGWFFFDWASQPYATLLLTFVFAPYVETLIGDGTKAQATWGFTTGAAALVIGLSAPLLGAMADRGASRMPWIWAFSGIYVVSATLLWFAVPGAPNLTLVLIFFGLGLVAMEFATIFTNAMLPSLATREDMGKVSGSGTAFGYCGGLIALVLMLTLFDDSNAGKTLIGLDPIFGLDPESRQGTRFVGPLTALWFAVFMVPFFLWVREPRRPDALPLRQAAAEALPELGQTLRALPRTPSLFRFLISSMLYRDALAGMYAFGGIYAAGVLDWEIRDIGLFGILAIVTAALFAWLGGRADSRFGPKPVILVSLVALTLIGVGIVFLSRTAVFGMPVGPDSTLPDVVFYILGAGLGAAGGTLQAASRTMMCRQAGEVSMTQAFGLYALAGKATAFLAPTAIGIATTVSGSQSWGITPVIALFLLGLILLVFVHPDGDRAE